MHYVLIVLLGLVVGVLVGLMGIGGGVVIIPALVYLAGMSQPMAQGTSLLILLPPTGLGALIVYWRQRQVDLLVGLTCSLGILIGGYFGGLLAVNIAPRTLHALFGLCLIFSAVGLWKESRNSVTAGKKNA